MARIDLAGKAICVSGASSGIGAATAIACARAGMNVCLMARREEKLRRVADAIGRLAPAGGATVGRVAMVVGDVTKADDCARAVRETVDAFGGIYSVYANAGWGLEARSHETTDDELRAIFETNFFGTMNMVRAAQGRLVEQGAGHVLICSSSIGKVAIPYCGAYCATKAAQWMMGRAMMHELRHRGVYCSTVHPVGTRTEFFETAKDKSPGNGSSLDDHAPGWMMQDAETVANATVKCLRRPRSEVWPSWALFVRYGIAGAMAFPGIGDWAMARMVRNKEREALRDREASPDDTARAGEIRTD